MDTAKNNEASPAMMFFPKGKCAASREDDGARPGFIDSSIGNTQLRTSREAASSTSQKSLFLES